MTDGAIGRTEPLIRSPGVVDRMGSATDRQPRRHNRQDLQEQERRNGQDPNRKRRRLYDLLFDEIDELDSLDADQRARIKQNLRSQLASRAPPPNAVPAQPVPEPDEEGIAAAILDDPAATVPVDQEGFVHMAAHAQAQGPPWRASPRQTAESALLAKQLRDCLARRTVTARRVAVYLHLLLTVDGALRPHTIIDA